MPKSKPLQRRNAFGGKGGGGGKGNGKKTKKMKSFARLSTTATAAAAASSSSSAAVASGKQAQAQAHTQKQKNKPHRQQQQQHNRPVVPFRRRDRILLVGEGDFSFARSLVLHHKCRNVMATCYDSQEVLFSKYPQAKRHVEDILAVAAAAAAAARSRKDSNGAKARHDRKEEDEGEGEGDFAATNEAVSTSSTSTTPANERRGPKVLYGVDARKLGLGAGGGGKEIRNGFTRRERKSGRRKRAAWRIAKEEARAASSGGRVLSSSSPASKLGLQGGGQAHGPWDLICFNFPHVGGLSTDVNRQVRANQELLVAFFKACVPLLSAPSSTVDEDDEEEDFTADDDEWDSDPGTDDDEDEDARPNTSKPSPRTEPGQILVTLFEGEPYTLWNIRDLARHSGLRVVTSFKFPWTSYPGYSHARTLGEVESKRDGGGRGGWRGEDREARMYVFEKKQEQNVRGNGNANGHNNGSGTGKGAKKRAREDDDDDSDSDDS